MKGALKAGFACVDITPPPGLAMDGYEARTKPASGVADSLHARACYVSDDTTQFCLVLLDVLGLARAVVEEAKDKISAATTIPTNNIILAATHTHAAPTGFAGTSQGLRERRNLKRTLNFVSAVAASAQARAGDVELSYGEAPTNGVASNRNAPDRRADTKVRVLRFDDKYGGGSKGLIANFACHPTVLGAANLLYSGDLHGRASDAAERRLKTTLLFTNGAEGDVSTRFTRREQNRADLDRLAGLLAEALEEAAYTAVSIGLPKRLKVKQYSAYLPYRELASPRVVREWYVRARENYKKSSGASPAERRALWVRIEGAQMLLRALRSRAGDARGVHVELTSARVAGATLVSVPGELFNDALTHLYNTPSWMVVGLANDYLGYFPTSEAFDEQTYEAIRTPFSAAAASALRDVITEAVGDAASHVNGSSLAGLGRS